jgi:hypothetical protein
VVGGGINILKIPSFQESLRYSSRERGILVVKEVDGQELEKGWRDKESDTRRITCGEDAAVHRQPRRFPYFCLFIAIDGDGARLGIISTSETRGLVG